MQSVPLGLRILFVVAVALAASLAMSGPGRPQLPLKRERIAVVPVYDLIMDSGPVVHLLRRYRNEVQGLKAVVLALDTPGGGVAASQEICEAIMDLQDAGIIVVSAMGSVAASGGYYIAAPSDRIVANPGTLTGSIGVIMETINARKILDKVGLDFEVVKSGEFKDSGNFTRALSARERALFQEVIDDVHGQFVQAVLEGRKEPLASALAASRKGDASQVSEGELRAYIRSFADGRVFSGRKAMQLGLVDELGGLDRAIQAAADLAHVKDPEVVTYRQARSFAELITGVSRAELKSWLGLEKILGAGTRRFGYFAW